MFLAFICSNLDDYGLYTLHGIFFLIILDKIASNI